MVISQTNSYVARTVGIQGGLDASAPYGYPGGDGAYISSSEMATKVANNFTKAGIKPGDYQITINGVPMGSNVEADYGEQISTNIKVNYKWSLISNFIPGGLQSSISSSRTVLSEFKYRYDSFKGE
jgi:hypothetical protein